MWFEQPRKETNWRLRCAHTIQDRTGISLPDAPRASLSRLFSPLFSTSKVGSGTPTRAASRIEHIWLLASEQVNFRRVNRDGADVCEDAGDRWLTPDPNNSAAGESCDRGIGRTAAVNWPRTGRCTRFLPNSCR